MKLYTEEQVKQMIDRAHGGYDGYYDVMSPFIPIELPNDEEIDDAALSFCNSQELSSDTSYYGFLGATQWMRDKIQGL